MNVPLPALCNVFHSSFGDKLSLQTRSSFLYSPPTRLHSLILEISAFQWRTKARMFSLLRVSGPKTLKHADPVELEKKATSPLLLPRLKYPFVPRHAAAMDNDR